MFTDFTIEDLKKGRSPGDLKNWVEQQLKSFATPEKIHSLRNNSAKTNEIKRLKEEIWPLVLYACKKYPADDVLIYPCANNGSGDAEIRDLQGHLIEKIEVALAIDGQRQNYQNIQLEKNGAASVPSRAQFAEHASNLRRDGVRWQDAKPSYYVHRGEALFDDECQFVKDIIIKKSGNKNYEGEMTLVIGYHNWLTADENWDVLKKLALEWCRTYLKATSFTRLVLVDVNERFDLIEI